MKKLFYLSVLLFSVLYSCSTQKTEINTNLKTVTGVVIGIEDGLPLPMATIRVKQNEKTH